MAGAATVIGSLAALIYGLGATEQHGWLSARVLVAFATLSGPRGRVQGPGAAQAANPLVPPHTWKVKSLVSGTTVMLGVTGILVGTVFLTSIFVQTVMGYSAIRAGVAFVPFALAITARHRRSPSTPWPTAPRAPSPPSACSSWPAERSCWPRRPPGPAFATGVLPGLAIIGLGVGMVFAPVSRSPPWPASRRSTPAWPPGSS